MLFITFLQKKETTHFIIGDGTYRNGINNCQADPNKRYNVKSLILNEKNGKFKLSIIKHCIITTGNSLYSLYKVRNR